MQETRPENLGSYSIIDKPAIFGKNVYVGNYVHIRPEVFIGDNTEIRDYCFLAEGCKIGSNTRIMQYSNIGSGVIIGNNCFISAGVIITNDRKIQWPKKPDGSWLKEPPIIMDNVLIGAGAIILAGILIGSGCKIGAGSVVTESTMPGLTYIGNPARAKQ